MQTVIGVLLLGGASAVTSMVFGMLFGLSLTAINNFILVPYFNAAQGSYGWWAQFHAFLWGTLGGAGSLVWGTVLAYSQRRP